MPEGGHHPQQPPLRQPPLGQPHQQGAGPPLRNRVCMLRLINKYLDNGFKVKYFSTIFRFRLMFGVVTWGGSSASYIRKVQVLQYQASKLALPKYLCKLSARQRQLKLDCLPVEKEVEKATTSSPIRSSTWGLLRSSEASCPST